MREGGVKVLADSGLCGYDEVILYVLFHVWLVDVGLCVKVSTVGCECYGV